MILLIVNNDWTLYLKNIIKHGETVHDLGGVGTVTLGGFLEHIGVHDGKVVIIVMDLGEGLRKFKYLCIMQWT